MKYKKIQLFNGIVKVTNDFIIVTDTVTPSANYAGVVAEKNDTIPYLLFLAEKPVCEFTSEEENKIYDLCGKICPEVEKVRNKEIKAKFDETGCVTNGDEWEKTPRLGIFEVQEVKGENNLCFGTGIIRRV